MNKNTIIRILGLILSSIVLSILFIRTPTNTLYVNNQVDSLNNIILKQQDSIDFYKNALDSSININNKFIHDVDSLNNEIIVYKYKLGRIKEYCNIVKKNKSQQVYLRGWINRVLDE